MTYEILHNHNGVPIKSWTRGVPFEEEARQQLKNIASLPFIYKWLSVMPDVHLGQGATIGTVLPTIGAVIPAAVGVDIGCGMIAVKTSLQAYQLPDNLAGIRAAIETAVPHGRSHFRGHRTAQHDKGAWREPPKDVTHAWNELKAGFEQLSEQHSALKNTNNIHHLGTLGTGNHFIEVCLDEEDQVWFMLHSGSRGVGNRIGTYFISMAKKDMERWMIHLPDKDLAYLPEGTEHFAQYIKAVEWAQDYARINREVMMARVISAVRTQMNESAKTFKTHIQAVNCHHNYVSRENHYNRNILVTRKGAVRARKGELGIIPGSMGARSYIVRGLGNHESFHSCSHGAGRVMSRNAAKKMISLNEHLTATKGIECRKDPDVIDESPAAYKPIDKVMAAQKDLVEIVHTLRQVVCVKG